MKHNRNICRDHFNRQQAITKKAKWEKNPLERKAHTIWQIAYGDCHRTFQVKMEMGISQVYNLMKQNNFSCYDDVRIIPVDPLLPLSMTNFCMTDAKSKFDMCFIWKNVHKPQDYISCFCSKCNIKIYASSLDLPMNEKTI
jgi:hypothetical protein